MIRWSWVQACGVVEQLDDEPSLEGLQELVGGYIAYVPETWLTEGVYALIVNEEAHMYDLAENAIANECLDVALSPILGDVVVCWDDITSAGLEESLYNSGA